jgi:circadian clock protein KaiB
MGGAGFSHNPSNLKEESCVETIGVKLFICGTSAAQQQRRDALEAFCKRHFKDRYHLEVIDVMKSPREASEHKVVATPTVISVTHSGEKRFVGGIPESASIWTALSAN